MRKSSKAVIGISLCSSGMFLVGTTVSASGQITGNLSTTSVNYGAPLALQTINTGFGNAAANSDSNSGSEVDVAYGTISGGNLDILLTGNFEHNGNHANIFVSGGAPGQSVLGLPATASMATMNGSAFSPGFQATYAYDMNDFSGTLYNEEYTYAGPGALAGGYVGSVSETSTGIAPASIPAGGGFPPFATIAINNNNGSTMGAPGAPTNPALVLAVQTGLELSIPLSQIGYTGGPIMVLADINGGGDSYLSNQFLPGLPPGTANLGGGGPFTGPSSGTFNFANTPGEYFTVSVPEPTSFGLVGGAVMMLCARRRKA